MGGLGLINRRRAIASSPTQAEVGLTSYVADSCVMWLDGIENGDDSAKWKDLVGNNTFTNYGAERVENGWKFAGSDSTYMKCDDNKKVSWSPVNAGNGRTLEVVISFEGSTHTEYVFVQGSGGIAFGRVSSMYLVVDNGVGSRFSFVNPHGLEPITCHFSCVCASRLGWENGASLNLAANPDYLNAGWYIGKAPSATGRAFKGTIHALRIHNRELTEEELAHNRAIDSIRFGLDLA